MKLKALAAIAGIACCISCIKTNSELGGNLIVVDETYDIYSTSCPITDIDMVMADKLSGYSSTRITLGAIREPEFGLTTRSSVITLVPLQEEMDFGEDPQFLRFHVSTAFDTVSVNTKDQAYILQNLLVYEPDEPLDHEKNFDINEDIPHGSEILTAGAPILNGRDSLSFDLKESYGKRFFELTEEDLKDFDAYMKKVPGLYLTTGKPLSDGGRINMFELQFNYDSDYGYIVGNYAKLAFRSKYDGVQKDSAFFFYLSATDFYDLDSLRTNSGFGSFPQYCLNIAGHESVSMAGKATDRILVEGGGGLKPRISAAALKKMALEQISQFGDPSRVVINKASIIFPFEYSSGMDYAKYPVMLSPTCRLVSDESTTFMGLTDASSESENQGDINYSLSQYAPDITYHLQEILKMDDDKINSGDYDIWLLNMAYETVTTTSSGNSELSDYYKALAYSQYYGDMYGGYGGGYGYGYGYGSYYGDPYSNYTSYMLAAQYASQSTTSSSQQLKLDKDRFYNAVLNGPASTSGRVPMFKLTFSIPKK